MFRTDWSIIRKIKCFITQAASGTVTSVVDVSCVAVGVRLSLTPAATHDRSMTEDPPDDGPIGPKHVETNKQGL